MNENQYISNTTASDNFGKGWQLAKSRFGMFLGVAVVFVLIDFITNQDIVRILFSINWKIAIGVIVYGFLIAGPIQMSTGWLFLKAARKEEYHFSDMFAVFKRNYIQAVFGGILWFILFVVGLIFFIIPGIIVAVRLFFMGYLIIDKKMDAWEAAKASWNMTQGHFWKIFTTGALGVLIIIGGILLLIMGLFPAIVWVSSSYAVLYNSIDSKK